MSPVTGLENQDAADKVPDCPIRMLHCVVALVAAHASQIHYSAGVDVAVAVDAVSVPDGATPLFPLPQIPWTEWSVVCVVP